MPLAPPIGSRPRLLRAPRLSACRRGYDHVWRAFRARVLYERPICEDCADAGYIRAARELHHVVALRDAPRRRLDDSNVRALCSSCHAKRTARGE
jgi:5-methylcytosine-specific restriction protein A